MSCPIVWLQELHVQVLNCNSLTKHFRPYLNRIKSVYFDDRYLMLKFGNKSV